MPYQKDIYPCGLSRPYLRVFLSSLLSIFIMISMILGGIQQNQAQPAQNAQNNHQSQKGTQRLNFKSNIDSAPMYGPHLPDEMFRKINENHGMIATILSAVLLESSVACHLLLRAPSDALTYVKSALNNKILKNTRIGWYGEDDDAENDTTSKAQAILSRGFKAQAIYKNIGIGWYGEDDTAEEDTPPSSVNKLEENKMLILKKLSQKATMKTLNHQLRKIVGMHSANRAAYAGMHSANRALNGMHSTCMRSV